MTSKEFLKKLCDKCDENSRLTGKANIGCPFRSISNDYCDEYEAIKKDLINCENLKQVIEIKLNELHKRQEYLQGCMFDYECYMEFNINKKKLELLFELKEVLK